MQCRNLTDGATPPATKTNRSTSPALSRRSGLDAPFLEAAVKARYSEGPSSPEPPVLSVASQTLSIDKSIGDHVWATANLAYVPNDAIGPLEPVENGAFIPIRVRDSPPPSAAQAAPAGRKAYLERVARLCDAMRARHGACVIHYVGFQPNDDRSNPIEETAEAAVSVYGVNDISERSKLETEVATLWPSL